MDAESLLPLHLAANNGHLKVAKALTAYWAPVDDSDLDLAETLDSNTVLGGLGFRISGFWFLGG
jgi:hypothetical protein